MDRRTALSFLGGGMAALAGCSSLPPGPSPSSPATGTATPTASPTASPAPVSVVGVDAPDTVEVTTEYEFAVRVRNPNPRAVTFRSGLDLRREGGSWTSLDGVVGGRVPAGETRSLAASLPPIAFLGAFELRLDVTGRTWSFETVPRRLRYGSPFTSPRDVEVVVRGGRFTDTYRGGGTDSRSTPPAGRRWLVVPVTLRPPGDGTVRFPPLGAFAAVVDGERYAVALADPGERLSLSGDRVDVELPFVVPADAAAVAVRWEPVYGGRPTGAVWRSAPS